MTIVPPAAEAAEITEMDSSARCSLLLMLGSGLLWLVLSGVLALVNLVQLHTPSFLADCAFFTDGTTPALQETAFLFGWAPNERLAGALREGGALADVAPTIPATLDLAQPVAMPGTRLLASVADGSHS